MSSGGKHSTPVPCIYLPGERILGRLLPEDLSKFSVFFVPKIPGAVAGAMMCVAADEFMSSRVAFNMVSCNPEDMRVKVSTVALVASISW